MVLSCLLPALTGCTASLSFDGLSGGEVEPKQQPCTWQLSEETRFPTSGLPFSLATADFDRDGKPDVVLAENEVFDDIWYAITEVHLNRGDREFEDWYSHSKNSAEGGSMPTRGTATGDVDADGVPDVVQVYSSFDDESGSVDLDYGLGDGRLDWKGIWTFAKGDDIAVGDFDGDGWLDAVASSLTAPGGYADEKLFFFWSDGQGSFESPVAYSPSKSFTKTIREIAVADLDGDGLSDVLVSSWGDATIRVLLGSSDRGMFQRPEVAVGSAPTGLVGADFDGDTKVDLAVVNNGDFTVSILFGTGDGGFAGETPISVGKNLQPIVATDLDADGDVDLAVGGQDEMFTLSNRGDGSFDGAVAHSFDGTVSRFDAADFDGDGRNDLALSNLSRESFSVYWSECPAPESPE
jgi:hypothetical protein